MKNAVNQYVITALLLGAVSAALVAQDSDTQSGTEQIDNVNSSAAPPLDGPGSNPDTALGGALADQISTAPEIKHWVDSAAIARDFTHQPPLIPHKVEEYKITINYNKCMSCHSWENYKREKATKISQTHFDDRDGNASSTVAARRYFCNQCHVPQVNATPLIGNAFQPAQ